MIKKQIDATKYFSMLLALALGLSMTSTMQAQTTLYWNAPNGGNGNWDTAIQNWATDPAGPLDTIWNNSNYDNAVFQNNAGAVSVDPGWIYVNNITFNVDGYTINDNTLALAGPSTPMITTATDVTATINSSITGFQGFNKRGLGTLIVSGNNYDLWGTVTIGVFNSNDGGVLRVTDSNALGNAAVLITGRAASSTDANPAQLQLSGGINLTNFITLQQKQNGLGHGPGAHGTPVLNEFPASIVNVGGDNTISNNISIIEGGNHAILESAAGNLLIASDIRNDASYVATSPRNLVLRGTSNGEILGYIGPGSNPNSISVWKEGSGTWTLSGENDGNVPFWVHDGVLRLNNSNALGNGSSTGAVTVASSIYDELYGTTTPTTGRIELDGSSSALNIPKDITLQGRNSASYTHFQNYSGNNTLSGDILLTQVDAIGANGNGSNYVIESSSGLLSLGNIKNNSTITSTRNLTLKGASSGEVNGVIGGGSAINPNDISVTKTDGGTWTLCNYNTYTGNTTINGGTLKIASSGSIASNLIDVVTGTFDVSDVSGYTLGNGKTIKGNGSVLGAMTVLGTVEPGESPGMLTVGNTIFGNASLLKIELAGTTPETLYDVLNCTGDLTMQSGSMLTVSLINSFMPISGDTFDILNFTGHSGAFSTINLPTLSGGLSWNLGDLYVGGSITVVPEPAALTMLLTSLAAIGLWTGIRKWRFK